MELHAPWPEVAPLIRVLLEAGYNIVETSEGVFTLSPVTKKAD